MMEEELRRLLKEYGWNLFERKRGEKEYLYAQKWRMGEVYISPRSRLPKVTEAEVLKKIGVSAQQ